MFKSIRFPWITLFVLASLLPCAPSWAWLDTGHKIIAMIAWEDLTPAAKAKIIEILKQHPRYDKDLLLDMPAGASPADEARYAFASAATWPDTVKSMTNPMHNLYSHPNWHFIDIPFDPSGVPLPTTTPAAAAAAAKGPHDVVTALSKNAADLKDSTVPASEQAVALCWIEHLTGDIHQPLHAAMLVSAQFPKGDQGGNGIEVIREPPYANTEMNLHLLWDEMPGDFRSLDMDSYVAMGMRNDPKFSRDKLKDLVAVHDFAAWAQESYALAVEDAYLNGKLEIAVAAQVKKDRTLPIPGVPRDYLEKGEHVAMHQLVLAGYRLADMLNSIYDPH